MNYFKVVSPLAGPVDIDTTFDNYGNSLKNQFVFRDFLGVITKWSEKNGFPLDVYFSLNNSMATGTFFLDLYNLINDKYDLAKIFPASNRSRLEICKSDLLRLVYEINKAYQKPFLEGNYLWEYIYEKSRSETFPDLPARHESLFLFETVQDCQYYIQKHDFFGEICQVEILEQKALFREI